MLHTAGAKAVKEAVAELLAMPPVALVPLIAPLGPASGYDETVEVRDVFGSDVYAEPVHAGAGLARRLVEWAEDDGVVKAFGGQWVTTDQDQLPLTILAVGVVLLDPDRPVAYIRRLTPVVLDQIGGGFNFMQPWPIVDILAGQVRARRGDYVPPTPNVACAIPGLRVTSWQAEGNVRQPAGSSDLEPGRESGPGAPHLPLGPDQACRGQLTGRAAPKHLTSDAEHHQRLE